MKTKIWHILTGIAVLSGLFTTAHGQIFEVNQNSASNNGIGTGTIGEYNLDGTTVNAALVSGLNVAEGLAMSGSNLYVTNYGSGTIGKYTTAGATVNAAFVSGLSNPFGLAVSGGNLFVTNEGNGTIGEYNATTGAVVNASLVSGLGRAYGILVSGSNMFVSSLGVSNNVETIGEYTTSGTTVNASLVSGLTLNAGNPALAMLGSNLLIGNASGTIGEYDATTGTTVNASLVSEPGGLYSFTVFGGNLFVTTSSNTIDVFTTSGAVVATALVSGLNDPQGILAIPEPSTYAALFGLATLGFAAYRRRKK